MTGSSSENPPRLSGVAAERHLWVLLAAVLLFFARPLFLGETFFFRDLSLLAYPERLRLVDLVRSSGAPLWDPYLHGGQPFLGNPSNLALYPTGLLYFVLPAVTAFNLEIVVHFLLCAFAAYALSRVLGLSPISSLIAGAAFTLCGFTLSMANLLNRLLAMPNAALLLLFWHLLLLERRARWFAAASACGALVLIAGSPEFLLLTLSIALGWALTWSYPEGSLRPARRALACAAVAAAAGGLAFVQIWPGLELVRQSTRGAGLPFGNVAAWSLHPARLLELLIPGFLGLTETLAETDYWGGRLENGYPVVLSISFGLPVLLFALTEGLAREDDRLPRRFRRFLLAAAGVSVVLALGRFAWLTPWVHRHLPLADLFRYPIKALFGAVLPLALLTGAGAGRLVRTGARPIWPEGRRPVFVAWAAVVVFGLLGAALAAGGPFAGAFGRVFFLAEAGEKGRPEIGVPFLKASAVALLLALILTLARRSRARAIPAAVAGLVLVDLAAAGRTVNSYAPREWLTAEPPNVPIVRRTAAGGRLFRDETPKSHSLVAPTNEAAWNFLWRRETLDFYLGNAFGIPVVFHEDYDGLAPRRIVRLATIVEGLPWDQRLPVLSAGAVAAIVTAQELSLPGLERVAELRSHGNRPLFLYRNGAAAARVGFVSTAAIVDSENDAVRALLSKRFDPRRHVVLEGRAAPVRPGKCAAARIVELERTPVSWKGRVTAECEGYLVFSESYDPGWKDAVDGRIVPTLRANVAFSAIAIGPGEHAVSRNYRPASVPAGAAVSAASVVLVGLLARAYGRAKPPGSTPAAAS